MEYILRTSGLKKRYKAQFAVNDADMHICRGDIYGFVGENGSGKTTIIRLITGLIYPNAGEFELFGIKNTDSDIVTVRRKMAAIVEAPSIYRNMSAYDNLKMQCILLGLDNAAQRIKNTLSLVGLAQLLTDKKKASNFSLGMRQRLGIAMALLSDPEFIVLDEPMNGLDPAGIVDVRNLIISLNREKGITFLISSHILTELSLVATKYGIISKGRIIKEISAEDLKNECRTKTVIHTENAEALGSLFKSGEGFDVSLIPGGIMFTGDIDLNAVLDKIIKAGIKILSVNCEETSIEDYYLRVTQSFKGGMGGASGD